MVRMAFVGFLIGYCLVGPWALEVMSHPGHGITGPG